MNCGGHDLGRALFKTLSYSAGMRSASKGYRPEKETAAGVLVSRLFWSNIKPQRGLRETEKKFATPVDTRGIDDKIRLPVAEK